MVWEQKFINTICGYLTSVYSHNYIVEIINDKEFCIYENGVKIYQTEQLFSISNHWRQRSLDAINFIHNEKLRHYMKTIKLTNNE